MSSYELLSSKKLIPTILKKNDNYKNPINRMEFTHLLITYLMSNKHYDVNTTTKYKDIDDNYINLASHLKIVSGYTDDTFKPYMNITRAEASVMIYNTEKQIAYLKSGSINRFKDYKFIPNWAVESVGAISNSNIINGYPDKTFAPSKNITKQEAFVIIAKLINSKSSTIDTFNISKNDEYMSKQQYDFVLNNIPSSVYKADIVKEKIFETKKDKRTLVYSIFNNIRPPSNNEIITSPNLIFDENSKTYIAGIEKRIVSKKTEQRVFMYDVYINNKNISYISNKEFGPWYTVQN